MNNENLCLSKNDNKCVLYHIRGFESKRLSLEKIAKKISAQIITLNETGLRFRQKPKLKDFTSFNRNRKAQKMGGVATLVNVKDKDEFVKVSGEKIMMSF